MNLKSVSNDHSIASTFSAVKRGRAAARIFLSRLQDMEEKISGIGINEKIFFYPMPQAGQHCGSLPALEFSVAGFLPSSTFGFSQEIMVPAVTAINIAWRRDLESFIFIKLCIPEYCSHSDNNISGNVANDIKISIAGYKINYVADGQGFTLTHADHDSGCVIGCETKTRGNSNQSMVYSDDK